MELLEKEETKHQEAMGKFSSVIEIQMLKILRMSVRVIRDPSA